MSFVRTERIYPIQHQSTFGRSVKEYTKIEAFVREVQSQTILDTGHCPIRRDHYLVIFRNLTVAVYIPVFDITRHQFRAADAILCRTVVNLFLTSEQSFGNVAGCPAQRFSCLRLPYIRIGRFILVNIFIFRISEIAAEVDMETFEYFFLPIDPQLDTLILYLTDITPRSS